MALNLWGFPHRWGKAQLQIGEIIGRTEEPCTASKFSTLHPNVGLFTNFNHLQNKEESKSTINLQTRRFDHIDSAVIISRPCFHYVVETSSFEIYCYFIFLFKLFSSYAYRIPTFTECLTINVRSVVSHV